jgi:hypothetical protein
MFLAYQIKMIKSKKGMAAWTWALIILVVIGAGIVIYSLLSGDSSPAGSISGNSIPQPPALPSG